MGLRVMISTSYRLNQAFARSVEEVSTWAVLDCTHSGVHPQWNVLDPFQDEGFSLSSGHALLSKSGDTLRLRRLCNFNFNFCQYHFSLSEFVVFFFLLLCRYYKHDRSYAKNSTPMVFSCAVIDAGTGIT